MKNRKYYAEHCLYGVNTSYDSVKKCKVLHGTQFYRAR